MLSGPSLDLQGLGVVLRRMRRSLRLWSSVQRTQLSEGAAELIGCLLVMGLPALLLVHACAHVPRSTYSSHRKVERQRAGTRQGVQRRAEKAARALALRHRGPRCAAGASQLRGCMRACAVCAERLKCHCGSTAGRCLGDVPGPTYPPCCGPAVRWLQAACFSCCARRGCEPQEVPDRSGHCAQCRRLSKVCE